MSASSSCSFQKATLLTLPTEVRDIIYSFFVVDKELDLTPLKLVEPNAQDASVADLLPATFRNCTGLVQASGTLQAEVLSYIRRHCGFVNAPSTVISKLPDLIGPGGCLMIQKLELRMEGGMLHYPRRNWPGYFELLVRDMPHLSEFKLSSSWTIEEDATEVPVEGEGEVTVTRKGYHRMRLLRFLSFLLLRHPGLDLLVWPAKCQARRQVGFGMVTECFVAQRQSFGYRRWALAAQPMLWATPQDLGIESAGSVDSIVFRFVEDEILASKAMRRMLENELAEAHLGDMIISPAEGMTKDIIPSSETPETDASLEVIDRDAYRDRYSPDLDDWIRQWRRRQPGGYSGAGSTSRASWRSRQTGRRNWR